MSSSSKNNSSRTKPQSDNTVGNIITGAIMYPLTLYGIFADKPLYTTITLSGALISSGLYGIFQPESMTNFFGLPPSPALSTLYPAVAGRNLSIGLATTVLSYQLFNAPTPQHAQFLRGVFAVVLGGWLSTGINDTIVCWRHGKRWSLHAGNTVLLGSVVASLARGIFW